MQGRLRRYSRASDPARDTHCSRYGLFGNARSDKVVLLGDAVPKPLGFMAFPPGFLGQESELEWSDSPSRNPGPWPALRSHPCVAVPSVQVLPVYPPSGRCHEKCLLKRHRSGYKYPCPGSPSLAGFEVSTDGRFSGVHRGPETVHPPSPPFIMGLSSI